MYCEVTSHSDGWRWALVDTHANRAYPRQRLFCSREECICDLRHLAPPEMSVLERIVPTFP